MAINFSRSIEAKLNSPLVLLGFGASQNKIAALFCLSLTGGSGRRRAIIFPP